MKCLILKKLKIVFLQTFCVVIAKNALLKIFDTRQTLVSARNTPKKDFQTCTESCIPFLRSAFEISIADVCAAKFTFA